MGSCGTGPALECRQKPEGSCPQLILGSCVLMALCMCVGVSFGPGIGREVLVLHMLVGV